MIEGAPLGVWLELDEGVHVAVGAEVWTQN